MPIEIVSLPPDSDYDGQKADVYSFGMLLYAFLYEKLPFSDNNLSVHAIINGIRPDFSKEEYPESIKELIQKCWDNDPIQRPEFTKIVEDLINWEMLICDPKDIDITLVNNFLAYCNEEPIFFLFSLVFLQEATIVSYNLWLNNI